MFQRMSATTNKLNDLMNQVNSVVGPRITRADAISKKANLKYSE